MVHLAAAPTRVNNVKYSSPYAESAFYVTWLLLFPSVWHDDGGVKKSLNPLI